MANYYSLYQTPEYIPQNAIKKNNSEFETVIVAAPTVASAPRTNKKYKKQIKSEILDIPLINEGVYCGASIIYDPNIDFDIMKKLYDGFDNNNEAVSAVIDARDLFEHIIEDEFHPIMAFSTLFFSVIMFAVEMVNMVMKYVNKRDKGCFLRFLNNVILFTMVIHCSILTKAKFMHKLSGGIGSITETQAKKHRRWIRLEIVVLVFFTIATISDIYAVAGYYEKMVITYDILLSDNFANPGKYYLFSAIFSVPMSTILAAAMFLFSVMGLDSIDKRSKIGLCQTPFL